MRYGTRISLTLLSGATILGGAALFAGTAQAADVEAPGLQNRSIAYVMFKEDKSIFSTHDGKQECPNGLNEGPREEYKILYPEIPGKKYTLDASKMNVPQAPKRPGRAAPPNPASNPQSARTSPTPPTGPPTSSPMRKASPSSRSPRPISSPPGRSVSGRWATAHASARVKPRSLLRRT